MKILVVGPAYPYRGGIANFADLFVEQLMKKNDVNVITFKRLYPSFLFPGKTQFHDKIISDLIMADRLINSTNPLNWRQIANKIIAKNPDVVIFSYWLPFIAPCYGKIAGILRKKSTAKILCLCHNILPHETHIGDVILTKYFFNLIDYFVVLSNKVVDDLIKLKPRAKYKILPHPVYSNFGKPLKKNEARRYLNLPENEKLILFFGFIRNYKGLDILLKAVGQLQDKTIKLIIAGEFYSNESQYKKLINDLKLEDNLLLFTEFIPSSEVKYYFSAVDVVILPYRNATQSGIVQIAMNFRKPVIATNVGGLEEVIVNDKTGYIVEKENPAALSEAIDKFFLENKETEFVKNIGVDIEKYSWEKFTNGILELIKS
jgi:glycosyltransferase involved in cell wall biosynthesis